MSAAPVVLDSHALVAYFRNEPGAETVETLFARAASSGRTLLMTEVNHAETKYTLIRKDSHDAWEDCSQILTGLPIEFHPVTRHLADQAADYKAAHKMSPVGAFAAALAKEMEAELVTGDPEFKPLEKEIKIRWLK